VICSTLLLGSASNSLGLEPPLLTSSRRLGRDAAALLDERRRKPVAHPPKRQIAISELRPLVGRDDA